MTTYEYNHYIKKVVLNYLKTLPFGKRTFYSIESYLKEKGYHIDKRHRNFISVWKYASGVTYFLSLNDKKYSISVSLDEINSLSFDTKDENTLEYEKQLLKDEYDSKVKEYNRCVNQIQDAIKRKDILHQEMLNLSVKFYENFKKSIETLK